MGGAIKTFIIEISAPMIGYQNLKLLTQSEQIPIDVLYSISLYTSARNGKEWQLAEESLSQILFTLSKYQTTVQKNQLNQTLQTLRTRKKMNMIHMTIGGLTLTFGVTLIVFLLFSVLFFTAKTIFG